MRIKFTTQHLKIFIIANVVSILVNFHLFDSLLKALISIVTGLVVSFIFVLIIALFEQRKNN
jgi:multisubunit Na+/H+ antiporter MnhB subunit